VSGGKDHVEPRVGSLRNGLLILVACLAAGFAVGRLRHCGGEPAPLHLARPAMGTLVEVTVPGTRDAAAASAALEAIQAALAEVARVDSLFSWRLPPPVQTPPGERAAERRELLAIGLRVLQLSDGAFDPRIGPLVALWGFDGQEPRLPPPGALTLAVARLADLARPARVSDLESAPEMLHFGAWAKGYAVDRALAVLRARGIEAALVNAGGEVRGYGRPWRVGVQHPRLPGAMLAALVPGDLAVATSGDYEQFFEVDGERYHHLLDPRSGEPARGCRSVTVLAADCALADALATAMFVMGPADGLDLVEQLRGVECLIIDADGRRHDSSGLAAHLAAD
jgi:FAD:protein FMN transferase